MFEVKFDKKNNKVIALHGKYVSSSVDAVRQSKKWLAEQQYLSELSYETIIVVGGGSGFHIKELDEIYGENHKIIVVEEHLPIIEHCQNEFLFTNSVHFIHVSDVLNLKKEKSLTSALANSYIVLDYYLQTFSSPLLINVKEYCLGRSKEGFSQIMLSRKNFLDIKNDVEDDQLVSLANVNLNTSVTNSYMQIQDQVYQDVVCYNMVKELIV